MFNSKYTGEEVEEAIDAVKNAGFHIVEVNTMLNNATYSVIENPEYVFVILDAAEHILYGIRRDKTVYIADCDLTRRLGTFPLTAGFHEAALDYMLETIDENLTPTSE